jgi:hypothetical protein
MCSRRELEGLIVFGLQETRRLERLLKRKWATLVAAPQTARVSFLRNLAEFQEQASRLEKLIDALDELAQRSELAAA